jgi:hypothetical protein
VPEILSVSFPRQRPDAGDTIVDLCSPKRP